MAKIRGVKPEFWTADGIVELSIPARLLFIGLWNYACDNGHLSDKPKQIKMRILPGDDEDVNALLDELADVGKQIERDGEWITIPDLAHHQKPHPRWWTTCEKPGCVVPEGKSKTPSNRGKPPSSTPHNGGATVAQPVPNGVATADGDGDGDGDGELMVITALPASAVKPTKPRATQRPADFRPGQAHVDLAAELGVDLRAEWQQFCDHHDAKGSTYKDWPAALRTWIRNAPKFRGARAAPASQPTRVQQHMALVEQLAAKEAAGSPISQIGHHQ